MTRSIIKWAGGKSKLLPYIIENIPSIFNNYFEPFVGGASVILKILELNTDTNKIFTISDINENLISMYNVVKNSLQDLQDELSKSQYINLSDNYYLNRIRFNNIKNQPDFIIEKAALFIYLNKCGYNGMYRENNKGGFNIPFGKMKNPIICDNNTLQVFSNIIRQVNILSCGYKHILKDVIKDDFIYMDPPYDETFSDYTKDKFGKEQQLQLKEFLDYLTKIGVKVMISNSATNYIKDLYKDYFIINLTTKYSIGGKNADRNEKQELLIKNYL